MAKYELEPWPGYTKQDDDQRLSTLEHKVGEARRRGDQLYALAVCAAVSSSEALERADGDKGAVERTATSLGSEIVSFAEEQLGDPGGWTPK